MAVADRLNKRKKMMFWSGILILLAIVLLPMSGYVVTGFGESQPSSAEPTIIFYRQFSKNRCFLR